MEHLKGEQNLSDRTVESYATAFGLLLAYCRRTHPNKVARLELADWDAPTIKAFLGHLESERGNSSRSRNQRLAALKSFLRYVLAKEPASMGVAQRVLEIPLKRCDKRLVGYLTEEEMEAVLQASNQPSWSGRRDYAMLLTAYNTAARVSELAGMKRSDARLDKRSGTIRILGKGRKERVVVLTPKTTAILRTWEAALSSDVVALFPNRSGVGISRSGVSRRLAAAVALASRHCKSLAGKRVSPHVIRHTTAMHLLQSGLDLAPLALFLGHENLDTVQDYVQADTAMKRKTLESLPRLHGGKPKSRAALEDDFTFLEELQKPEKREPSKEP